MSTTTVIQTETAPQITPKADTQTKQYPQALSVSGALDSKFKYEELTPVIGREYPTLNLVDEVINAENSVELIRDLAITISQRGVVFFRAQDNLTDDLQKVLAQKLGELTGKPSDSTLHIHPLLNGAHNEFGVTDDEISTIASKGRQTLFQRPNGRAGSSTKDRDDRKEGAATWHSDIQFEQYPADYTSLRLTELPSTGGDTLWASGYELYDRYSDAYRNFFEGLTATFKGDGFLRAANTFPEQFMIYEKQRGHPENVGRELTAVHPVVRTNPVTGWKSIFAIGNFPHRINELSAKESKELLASFYREIEGNHDLQVRFKWKQPNDYAIWDNRSVFHSATNDYDHIGDRVGHRTVGIGEKPYLDTQSQSRSAALGI